MKSAAGSKRLEGERRGCLFVSALGRRGYRLRKTERGTQHIINATSLTHFLIPWQRGFMEKFVRI